MRHGSTVYSLMHSGWYKGKETHKNRIYFSVNVDHESGLSSEDVAQEIIDVYKQRDELLAALKYARSNGIFATFIHKELDDIITKIEGQS
jgi:hypothetical protein